MVTAVLKKLPLKKVPSAELFELLNKSVSSVTSDDDDDEDPVDDVRFPNNDDSPVLVEAPVALLAELVPAEVAEAWATAADWPASPVALVVWAGWLNGVSCDAAAEDPA